MGEALQALFVEDNEDDVALALLELRRNGFTTRHQRVQTAQELRNALNGNAWDIIFSDYTMPQFSALGALAIAKEMCPDVPFVIISGTISEETAVAAMRGGARDYLIKGNLTRLGAAVHWQLAESETLRQRRRAESALFASEERYRTLVEGIKDYGIFMLDPDGKIVSANAALTTLTGHPTEDLIGRDLALLCPKGSEDDLRAQLARARDHGRSEVDHWLVRKDGRRFWAHCATYALTDAAGQAIGFTCLMNDQTEKRREQAAREELYQKALEANRLKDEFLATISHEMRTPLTAILGQAQLMELMGPPNHRFAEALGSIIRNGRLQERLVNDMLDMSRISAGKMTLRLRRFDLRAEIAASWPAIRKAAEDKGVALELRLPETLPPMTGDPDRVHQILAIILDNAVKFTPAGGKVEVSAACHGDEVELRVADSGCGISPEFMPHVFERFRQEDASTGRRYGGLGLGLAIAKHLVGMHGGRVGAESAGPDHGAVFTVVLPLAGPAPAPALPPPTA